jgi:hypothetical protein
LKYSSLKGKMCNLLIKHPEWKDNQWCKRTKSFTEFQNGVAPENQTLLHKPLEMFAIKLNDSSTPRTGIRGSLEISETNCSGDGFEAASTTAVAARKRTWTTERSCPSVRPFVCWGPETQNQDLDRQTHKQCNLHNKKSHWQKIFYLSLNHWCEHKIVVLQSIFDNKSISEI